MTHSNTGQCVWTKGATSRLVQMYDTSCGSEGAFMIGSGPGVLGFKYCPYCGGKLVIDKHAAQWKIRHALEAQQ